MRIATCLTAVLLVVAGGGAFAADPESRLYVSSEGADVIVVLRTADFSRAGMIRTAQRPQALRLAPDGRHLFVACSGGSVIDVIDIERLAVVGRIDVGDDPEMFDIGPGGRFLYTSNEHDGLLTVYDLELKYKVAEVQVGAEPEGVLVSADGRQVYVTSEANMVHVVDTATRQVTANVLVGNRPRRFLELPQRSELWVTNELSGSVSIIDTDTHELVETVTLQPRGFRAHHVTPVDITASADGSTAYVTLGRANHVAVVDVATRSISDYVPVGRRAWGVTLSPDQRTLYVANGLSDDISVIDTASGRVVRSVPVARTPHSIVFR